MIDPSGFVALTDITGVNDNSSTLHHIIATTVRIKSAMLIQLKLIAFEELFLSQLFTYVLKDTLTFPERSTRE
jgi:hypothetical protein